MAAAADRVRLEPSWKAALAGEFESGYMARLRSFLVEEKQARKTVYPRGEHIFAALDATPLESVKVVIIGQDPYHGPRQAHGLCFSVQTGVALPPSLTNIFEEINTDMADDDVPCGRHDGAVPPGKGCLAPWARQGVLLLNAVLTVVAGRAGSHQGRGWETFTDRRGGDRQPGTPTRGVHALGQLRPEERRGSGHVPPSRADVAAPVAAVGSSWVLRVSPLLQGEPVKWSGKFRQYAK